MTQVKWKMCLCIGQVVEECRTQNENFPKNNQNFNSKQHSKSNVSTSARYAHNQEDDFKLSTTNQGIDFADSIATNKLMRKDYEDDWIIDIGATQHMCYRKYYFWTYQDMEPNIIYLADGTTHTPQGKGPFHFSLPGIGKVLLSNVWYVPTFKNNSLSLALIRQGSHRIIMEDGLIKINSVKHDFKMVMTGYEDEKLLTIQDMVIPHT
jgi:hypothetical protein